VVILDNGMGARCVAGGTAGPGRRPPQIRRVYAAAQAQASERQCIVATNEDPMAATALLGSAEALIAGGCLVGNHHHSKGADEWRKRKRFMWGIFTPGGSNYERNDQNASDQK
jgi:hypothetical protein